LQKSIFEVSARGGVFEQMRRRVEAVIMPKADGVQYFPLCEKCAGNVEIIGQGGFIDPEQKTNAILLLDRPLVISLWCGMRDPFAIPLEDVPKKRSN